MLSSGIVFRSVQCQVNCENSRHNEDSLSDSSAAQCLISLRGQKNGLESKNTKQGQAVLSNGSSCTNIRQYFQSNIPTEIIKELKEEPDSLVNNVEKTISPESKVLIDSILQQIKKLSTVEKLLLYLKLPTEQDVQNPLKQPINALGSRPEISQTIMWIKTHLCEDKKTSLPKQDVYNEYLDYCNENEIKPLSTPDFGKVMKQVFVNVKPRRLGTRGNSRYCYAGMAKRDRLPPPHLPVIPPPQKTDEVEESPHNEIICSWASDVLGKPINNLKDLKTYLIEKSCKNEDTAGDEYIFSSKVAVASSSPTIKGKPLVTVESKRKSEEDSGNSSKMSDYCSKSKKGRKQTKKTSKKEVNPEPSGESVTIKTEETNLGLPADDKATNLAAQLMKIPKAQNQLTLPASKKQKPQPKGNVKPDLELMESGNSLEMEEELLKYFQGVGEVQKLDSEPKLSHLRMLLEKNTAPALKNAEATRRRVSFDTAPQTSNSVPPSPSSQKTFSFVPISPITEVGSFLSPRLKGSSPHKVLNRSNSDQSPLYVKNEIKRKFETPLLQNMLQHAKPSSESSSSIEMPVPPETNFRSQSVPMVPAACSLVLMSPHSSSVQFPLLSDMVTETPVPSELIDFDADSTNLLSSVHEESSSDSLMNPYNINQIINIIDSLDKRDLQPPHSYPGTPVCHNSRDPIVSAFPRLAKSYPSTPSVGPLVLPPRRSSVPPVIDPDLTLLPDDLSLECEDTFNNLAREMSTVNCEIITPD